jgi:invasion protein IalB
MWKWLIFIGIAVVLLMGAVAWFLTTGKDLPGQATHVEDQPIGATQGNKSVALSPGQKPQAKSAGPGWAVNCKSGARDVGLSCRLSQTVVMKQSGRLLTRVTFLLPTPVQKPQINFQLPLGIRVPAGTTFQIDDNGPQSLRLRTCDRNGCYAETTLSSELLAQLRSGSKLTISFKNLAEKTISVSMSLGGFQEAYAKAKST